MVNRRICDWDPCWTVESFPPVHVGAVLTQDQPACVGVAVGVTTTTTQAAKVGLADARELIDYLQWAIDECERDLHLCGERDKARTTALDYLRAPGGTADNAERDAAIVRAFDARETFAEIARVAGLDTDRVREIWHTHHACAQGNEGA